MLMQMCYTYGVVKFTKVITKGIKYLIFLEVSFNPKMFSIRFTDLLYYISATYRGGCKADIASPLSDHIEIFEPRQRSTPPFSS